MLTLLFLATATLAANIAELDEADQFMHTPFGYYHTACIHGVDSGSEIINFDDEIQVKSPDMQYTALRRVIPRCKYQHNATYINARMAELVDYYPEAAFSGSGWQQYTKMNAGNTVDSFDGEWMVPKASPSQGGPILYMFTGLQNIDWVPPERQPSEPFDIIQPVMQYGSSAAGGGNYWSCASWYVTLTNDVVHGRAFKINQGDTIYGNMTKTGSDSWYIDCVDKSSSTQQHDHITVTKSILKAQPWIYVTLEVYGVRSCNEYPPKGTKLPFTKMVLTKNGQNSAINWVVGQNGQKPPPCDPSIQIVSPSAVTITF